MNNSPREQTSLLFNLTQAMFSTDLMESRQERVAINGVEPQMIGMLVSYAYTSVVVISKANVQVMYFHKPYIIWQQLLITFLAIILSVYKFTTRHILTRAIFRIS